MAIISTLCNQDNHIEDKGYQRDEIGLYSHTFLQKYMQLLRFL